MKDNELLQEISRKLSVLIALQLQNDDKSSVQGKVTKLTGFGLGTAEIAEILGTTPGTVAVLKSRVKRNKNK